MLWATNCNEKKKYRRCWCLRPLHSRAPGRMANHLGHARTSHAEACGIAATGRGMYRPRHVLATGSGRSLPFIHQLVLQIEVFIQCCSLAVRPPLVGCRCNGTGLLRI